MGKETQKHNLEKFENRLKKTQKNNNPQNPEASLGGGRRKCTKNYQADFDTLRPKFFFFFSRLWEISISELFCFVFLI